MALEKASLLLKAKDGKLELHGSFESDIRGIVKENGEKPLIVVCLIGKYRGGKSTLLNELVGKPDAFSTGNDTEAVTKGVWYYIVVKKDKYIIYLDAEGNDDPDNQETMDKMLLWCFTASSEFMYNTKDAVGQVMLKELFNLAQLQKKYISDGSRKPHLRVLLRDFGLNLKGSTATQYLVDKLAPGPDTDQSCTEKDLVRNFYQDVQAYAFKMHPYVVNKQHGGPLRQELKTDVFAEKIKELEHDIITDKFHYQVGDKEFGIQEWSTFVSSRMIEVINKSEQIDLSQSWMTELQKILKAGTDKMSSIIKESSILDIVKMEKEGWEIVCGSLPKEAFTSYLMLMWQEKVKQTYMDNFECMAHSSIQKLLNADCLDEFCNIKEQLWKTDTADNWFITLCKGIWLKEAEKQQSEIIDAVEKLGEETEKHEEASTTREILENLENLQSSSEEELDTLIQLILDYIKWKKARVKTIRSFKKIQNDLKEAEKSNDSRNWFIGTAGTIASAIRNPKALVSSLVFGATVYLGGKIWDYFRAKGIPDEQLKTFNDVLEADQELIDSFLKTLSVMNENLKLMPQPTVSTPVWGIPFGIRSLITRLNNINSDKDLIKFIDTAIQQLHEELTPIKRIMMFSALQKIKLLLSIAC